MASHLSQYLNELRTCRRLAATPLAFLGLAARTEEFHLRNLLRRKSTDSGSKAEKHRIRLGNQSRELSLRPGTGDIFIFHEVFTNECYRVPNAILTDARTIVDLGANIGMTSVFLSQYFPDARYICVEPNPRNAELLRRNVAGLGSRVSVVESAVSDYCGDISFSDSEWSWGGHIESAKAGNRRVPCLTVAKLLELERIDYIDLLKIDIEGAEELIFSGSPEWLMKVGCIIIEFHGRYGLPQFEHDLKPFGFNILPEGSVIGSSMNMAISNSSRISYI